MKTQNKSVFPTRLTISNNYPHFSMKYSNICIILYFKMFNLCEYLSFLRKLNMSDLPKESELPDDSSVLSLITLQKPVNIL